MLFRSRNEQEKQQGKSESKNELMAYRPILNTDFLLENGQSLLIIIGTHGHRSIFIETVNNDNTSKINARNA